MTTPNPIEVFVVQFIDNSLGSMHQQLNFVCVGQPI